MYDTSRAWPTLVEKRLYAKLLNRGNWNVRDAARLVARFLRQPRGVWTHGFGACMHANSVVVALCGMCVVAGEACRFHAS
jgi:hypothetical protein